MKDLRFDTEVSTYLHKIFLNFVSIVYDALLILT
jgi:hypothetical protein